MEIRDVIHGAIQVDRAELPILDSRYFQRLRHIKQLGFGEQSFPAASHNRYIHSLGAMSTATQAFDTIFGGPQARQSQFVRGGTQGFYLTHPDTHARFRACTRLAALLHDIGHGPLSHTSEIAMPEVSQLALPAPVSRPSGRRATHEDYTLKILLDSDLSPLIDAAGRPHGFTSLHVASLIDETIPIEDDFFCEIIEGEKINFRPILKQLISSELDADRMDYLRRDSLNAGVSYGNFDYDWLVSNLSASFQNGNCYLSLQHRALYAFEDFLISRYHMFLMVYFHYKSVIYDEMLRQYFNSEDCTYHLPADIEAYCECNDAHLYTDLRDSKNQWARRIIDKEPYKMLIEVHSGIPASQGALDEQLRIVEEIQADLRATHTPFLTSKSKGELSKYFDKQGDPIFVRYDNHYSAPSLIRLEDCTDLFQRYEKRRWIIRTYVSPEDYPALRTQGREAKVNFPRSLELGNQQAKHLLDA